MNDETQLTQEELRTLIALRNKGYAIILWTPDELKGVDPYIIEDASISFGWDTIDYQLTSEVTQ